MEIVKTRKLSPAFVERQIERVDEMNACPVEPLPDLPKDYRFPIDNASLRRLTKQRRDAGYVQGFWAGWVLAKGDQS